MAVVVDGSARTRPGAGTRISLLAVCLGFFVIQLDATIVNVALPSIARDFGGGLSRLQWVVDAYTLVLAGLMLTAGALAANRANVVSTSPSL